MRYYFLMIFMVFSFSLTAKENSSDEDNDSLFYMLSLNNRFEIKRNYLNSDKPESLTFSENSTGYYFYAVGTLIWFINDNTEFNLSLGSGIMIIRGLYYENGKTNTTINYETASDYAQKSLFVDEVYFEYDGSLRLSFGKKNLSASTDFVFNDYVFFARTDFYLYKKQKRELTLGLQYNTIDGYFNADYKSSPMITADITYKNGKVFGLSFFSSFLYDNDSAFGNVYEPFVEAFLVKKMSESGIDPATVCGGDLSGCLRVDSKGYLIWLGFELNGKSASFHYRLSIAGNYGDMEVFPYIYSNGQTIDIYNKKKKSGKLLQYLKYGDTGMSQETQDSSGTQSGMLNKTLSDRKLLGYMGFAEAGYRFFKLIDISPYFLFMSGENDLEKSSFLNSFVSVKSYITLSNIFFNGGLNETASSRSFSMAGVNGRGVINPGLWIKFKKEELPLKLNFGVMKFYASARNTNDKIDYGTELDFVSSYSLLKFMDVSLETDYFIAGDFFRSGGQTVENPFKILLGLNLFLDNLD